MLTDLDLRVSIEVSTNTYIFTYILKLKFKSRSNFKLIDLMLIEYNVKYPFTRKNLSSSYKCMNLALSEYI